ncbi:MAG: NAD+ synthase [Elusimicrobia bacterium]|jgi:NAD+ synthase (glutamine-hydrolysing)|nr:NAD+ synthase [Elusimicrobiota bacterium]
MIRLGLAQINPTVGDLAGNIAKILSFSQTAQKEGADLVLFPEMALTGYPPEDLLFEPLFLTKTEKALHSLMKAVPRDLLVVVGAPEGKVGALYNAAFALFGGKIRARYHKWFLPNYGVFDEERYFREGIQPTILDLGEVRLGLTICEDIWRPKGPALAAAEKGASLILNLSASPYHAGKTKLRLTVLQKKSRECGTALAYCNMVGGQDELVYDGGSGVMDRRGNLVAQAPLFKEHLLLTDLSLPRVRGRSADISISLPERDHPPLPSEPTRSLGKVEEIYTALTLGIQDYVKKNGFSKVVIGLSGGIDSALVATIAVDALGKENVVGVSLPSRFNSVETRGDAEQLAENLDIDFLTVGIEDTVQSFLKALNSLFTGRPIDVTEENLQSRVRGTFLMALSNKFGWLVLTTGNKSEISAGYFTLYGDSVGGFAVIKDIPKTTVYELAHWRNAQTKKPVIPPTTITRAPTAELRPHQKDQDTLPPYDILDTIISQHVEENKGLAEIVKKGIEPGVAAKTLRTIDAMEYKRRQAPPGIKITPRAFGRDRRMPITNKFRPYDV